MKALTSLEHRITRLLSDHLAIEVSAADLDLVDAGYLDSMILVSLLDHLETEFAFRIRLDDLEIDHFRSIERIAEFIASRSVAPPSRGDVARDGGRPVI